MIPFSPSDSVLMREPSARADEEGLAAGSVGLESVFALVSVTGLTSFVVGTFWEGNWSADMTVDG